MDKGFIKQTGPNKSGGTLSTALPAMAKYITDTNALFEPQLQVSMTVGAVYSGTKLNNTGIANTLDVEKVNPNADGNTAICTDEPEPLTHSLRLRRLRDWREAHSAINSDSHAVWHLLTSCHPEPGSVGTAFIGVLCHTYV